MLVEDQKRPIEIFTEFWSFVDEHYIYFDQKDVDWNEVRDRYSRLIEDTMTEEELYRVCHEALLELRDGHNRIETPNLYVPSYNFQEGYTIEFSAELIEQEYLNSSIQRIGNIHYGIVSDNIGYVYISDMERYGSFSTIVREMKEQGVIGLVIDIRNNGGGDSNPVIDILSDFVSESRTLGYYIEKSGPGHDDITELMEVRAEPSSDFTFDLPVVVLTNRKSYSASSYFASMFGELPSVTLVGQITGGGGGGNYGYQLSNQWIVAVSASDFVNSDLESIEPGVKPDIEIENSKDRLEAGFDDMLEKALNIIQN